MSDWHERRAPAKVNLGLVVGPLRADGKHEVVTVYERLTLADTVAVRRADGTRVTGYEGDTLVRAALDAIASAAEARPRFEARIEKRVPVASGLGGGSSDAAAALLLANALLEHPLADAELHRLGASLGADVPFFLGTGPQLATGDGTILEPVSLPRDYEVVLAWPGGARKESTAAVYAAFDARNGAVGFDARSTEFREALARVRVGADLAALPPNDLASSPLVVEMRELGAFRADVTGAGPVVYGLFATAAEARVAAAALAADAQVWTARPG